jgi:site-specific recombinase XerD
MKPIQQHVLDWLEAMRVRNFTPRSIQTYEYRIRRFVAYLDKQRIKDVRLVDKDLIRRYWRSIVTLPEPLSIHSMGSECRTVKLFFRFLLESGEVIQDPSVVLKDPGPKGTKAPTAPSHALVLKILNTPNVASRTGLRDRAEMEVMYSTGIRVHECAQLTVFDLDIQGGSLRVNGGKGRVDREVPLGVEASRWLRRYLEEVRPVYAARSKTPTDRLWLGTQGTPQTVLTIEFQMRQYRKRSGCKFAVTPHALRRAMATGMLANGAKMTTIGKILGHSDLKHTAKYAQALPEHVQRTFNKTHPRQRSGLSGA